MFAQYPYLNLNDFNLDYILKAIKDMRYEVTNFVSINAIKYADPIQWNITSQYEKNTIVIDPVTGTAYISVAPVPVGVALTRPEYWTVVFDLQSFVTKANQNLANNYESQTTTTATMNTAAGEWVIWGDVLYKALVNITAGDAYVVGSNIQRITIEDVIKAILQDIADEVQARQDADDAINAKIGDLDDLTTSDKSSIVNAINDEVQARQDADDALAQAIVDVTTSYATVADMIADTTLSNGDVTYCAGFYAAGDGGAAIYNISNAASGYNHELANELYANIALQNTMCPEQFGAKGDGIADDCAAINTAMTYAKKLVFNKKYKLIADPDPSDLFHPFITIPSDRILTGIGSIELAPNNYDQYAILFAGPVNGVYPANIIIDGLTIVGDKSAHTGTTGQWGFGVAIFGSSGIVVKNCKISYCWGDGVYVGRYSTDVEIPNDIIIDGNIIDNVRRNGVSVVSCVNAQISNNIITNTSGHAPQAGIDLEPDVNDIDVVDNIMVNNNIIKDNAGSGVQIVVTKLASGTYIANTRNINIIGNDISGATCTAVLLTNLNSDTSMGAAFSNYNIKGNTVHDCLIAVNIHAVSCVIDGNTFKNLDQFTQLNIIRCDTCYQDDIFIINNVFDNCRGSQSIVDVQDAVLNFIGNMVMYPAAASTIKFNYMAVIMRNTFASYIRNYQLNVIDYSGTTGYFTISDNLVTLRNATSPLVFINSSLAAATTGLACVSNNNVNGATFANITNTYGGNNFFNGASV